MDETWTWYFVIWFFEFDQAGRRIGSSAMRKSKIEQVAEARRGVRAVVLAGDKSRIL
jgi:hypothetical protein